MRFSVPTARGLQLMHRLPHEPGRHHDRMTTRSRRESARGAGYVERHANRYSAETWNRYVEAFGWQ